MTIETKYNIGEEVFWSTEKHKGIGIVKGIDVSVSEGYQQAWYKVWIQEPNGIHLVFREQDIDKKV